MPKNKLKRDVSLTDTSEECIVITLWSGECEQCEDTGTCVLIHNGVIVQYNSIETISCWPNTLFWHDPDMEMANELKSWFHQEIQKINI